MSAALPGVAVVVPLYNGRRFVLEALASIRAQTWPALQTIVVDDGSADDGAELVGRAHPEVVLLRQANAGEAAARNRGIRESRADFLAFLDQDDRWLPEKTSRQMALLLADPGLDLVIGGQRLEAEGEEAHWVRAKMLHQEMPGWVPGALLARRRAFEQVGLFREELRIGSDTAWFMAAHDRGLRSATLGDCVLVRRMHAANASRDAARSYRALLQILHERLQQRRPGR